MFVAVASLALTAQRPIPPAIDEWWRDAVFYEVFVRSFADSTEGPLAGDGIGDLRGIIERLDYLNDGNPETNDDLGITAIWLMPICESPSYHGYDVVDYKTVDHEYGTNDDFKALVAACHQRGIRIIVDDVLNHCSSQHPWFQSALDPGSDKHEWFVWRDQPPPEPGGPRHPVWHDQSIARTGQYYYGFFWHGMPDLNLRSAGATQAMHEQSQFWLADMGADGLRLDAIHHLIEDWPQFEHTPETFSWLRDFADAMHAVKPGVFLVGEAWGDPDTIARYIQSGLDSAFAFPLCFAIENGLNQGSAHGIADALAEAWIAMRGTQSTIIGNHDIDRVMSRLGGNTDKAACAATILLTTPGIPFIYYGEEIGMQGTKPDPDIRTPMQWTADPDNAGFSTATPWKPIHPSVTRINVETQSGDDGSLLSHYRRLIRLRQTQPALSRGGFRLLETGDDRVLAFLRQTPGQRLLVLINVSGEQARDGWALDARAVDLQDGTHLTELIHAVPVQAPQRADDRAWRPLPALEPRAGFVIQLP